MKIHISCEHSKGNYSYKQDDGQRHGMEIKEESKIKTMVQGCLVAQSDGQLPSVQVMIPGAQDRVCHWGSQLCWETASPSKFSALVLSLTLSLIQINK